MKFGNWVFGWVLSTRIIVFSFYSEGNKRLEVQWPSWCSPHGKEPADSDRWVPASQRGKPCCVTTERETSHHQVWWPGISPSLRLDPTSRKAPAAEIAPWGCFSECRVVGIQAGIPQQCWLVIAMFISDFKPLQFQPSAARIRSVCLFFEAPHISQTAKPRHWELGRAGTGHWEPGSDTAAPRPGLQSTCCDEQTGEPAFASKTIFRMIKNERKSNNIFPGWVRTQKSRD